MVSSHSTYPTEHCPAPQLVVVVPCYNEAARLDGGKFLEFAERFSNVRLLLVNDGSTDATRGLLLQLSDRAPDQFRVCDLKENQGKGEAVRRGIREALTAGPEYVAFWDADLATPLEEIPRFLDVLERRPRVQLVIGSRISLPAYHVQRCRTRRLLARVFRLAVSWLLGLPLHDTQCGAKVFRVTPRTEVLFREPFLSRWIFDVEILVRLHHQRQPVVELPLESWREVSDSRLRWHDFFRGAAELAAIFWKYRVVPETGQEGEEMVSTETTRESRGTNKKHGCLGKKVEGK